MTFIKKSCNEIEEKTTSKYHVINEKIKLKEIGVERRGGRHEGDIAGENDPIKWLINFDFVTVAVNYN